MPQWTQDEAIAFECAREVITSMMAIKTMLIAEEMKKVNPCIESVTVLRAERSCLSKERTDLHVENQTENNRVRAQYAAIVRAWHPRTKNC